jgi:purine-nucleoside/S-methyl-5'-thioadenosine phosphorylase / adenosine deaminase
MARKSPPSGARALATVNGCCGATIPAMTDLPVPDSSFRWSEESWGAALRCRPLERVAQHLFTTRQLQLRGGTDQERRWDEAARALGADATRLMRVKQVHGRVVRTVHREMDLGAEAALRPEADAIVSDAPDLLLAVQVADCVPLLMADARSGAVAAVHAGWRGTAAHVSHAAIETLAREFGTKPADLIVAAGPSIGPCCYEVGAELIDAFRQTGATDDELARWFVRVADGTLRLDLWNATHDQLVAAGVDARRIYACRLCTRTHADIFDSYRADGPNAGRLAALIKVPSSSGM